MVDPIYGVVALLAAGMFFMAVGFAPTRALRNLWRDFKDWMVICSIALVYGSLILGYLLVWVGIPLLICIALIKMIGGMR